MDFTAFTDMDYECHEWNTSSLSTLSRETTNKSIMHKWDLAKLRMLDVCVAEQNDENSEEWLKILSHMKFLKVICSNIVPSEVIMQQVPANEQCNNIIKSLDFSSILMSDELCIPLAYSILNCCVRKSENMDVLYSMVESLLSSTKSTNNKIKIFVTDLWNKYLDNELDLPICLVEQIIEKNQILIEKYVLRIITENSKNSSDDTSHVNSDYLALICSTSAYIFQIVTSIINEILISTSTEFFPFINKFVNLIKNHCKSKKIDIVSLYPYKLQPLVGILSLCPETCTNTNDIANLQNFIQNAVCQKQNFKEILALFSHFPEWLPYVKLSTRKI